MVYNQVETQDSRWINLYSAKYQFIDFIAKPVWIGAERINERNVTYDGESYNIENLNTLLGVYYFYHGEKREHLRIAMTWLTVGAKVGGLKEILLLCM